MERPFWEALDFPFLHSTEGVLLAALVLALLLWIVSLGIAWIFHRWRG